MQAATQPGQDMTVWFDVTDLCIWHASHLTGIQRTVVNVLAELLHLRNDVRLFRYDMRLGDFEEVDGSVLPAAIRQRVFGVAPSVEPLPAQAAVPSEPTHVLRPAPSASTRLSRRPLRQHLASLVRRWGDDQILYALKDCARDTHVLMSAIRARLRKSPHAISAEEQPLPPPLLPATTSPPSRPFFRSSDVCLSLSATWGFTGYPEAIARHKAATGFTCINLIYDLIPTLFPQWISLGFPKIITLWARQQIANSDLLLTISEFQKQEIETFIKKSDLPLPPVRAIRLGDNAKLLTDKEPPLPRMAPRRPFVLCVSTVDVRKNQLCLYHVWRRLAQSLGPACPELLLVGMSHELVSNLLHQIRYDPTVNQLISHVRDVVDAELAWYYRNCLFTVYPSIYEGWGLPVGESLAQGRYCIASNAASLPEVGGPLVDYFDPLDYMDCYRKILRAIEEPGHVQQREALIRRTYQPTAWRDTAAQISAHVDAAQAGRVSAGRSAA
jgi:glycosyltransferase involved in cell wall biosynthesis